MNIYQQLAVAFVWVALTVLTVRWIFGPALDGDNRRRTAMLLAGGTMLIVNIANLVVAFIGDRTILGVGFAASIGAIGQALWETRTIDEKRPR